MDSYADADDILLPFADQPPSPIPKLKRLKKKAAPSPAAPPNVPIVPPLDPVSSAGLAAPCRVPELEGSQGTGKEAGLDAEDLDPLSEGILRGERMDPDLSRKEKSAKKRPSLEDEEASANKKKKKKKARSEKPKESVRDMKRIEKERKACLEQIHAESQRLLRETRDASFKPVAPVQRPISSILEKIRMRKQQVSRRCTVIEQPFCFAAADSAVDEIVPDSGVIKSRIDVTNDDCVPLVQSFSSACGRSKTSRPDLNGTAPRTTASDVCTKDALHNPRTNIQDFSNDSQQNGGENNLLQDGIDETAEDIPVPSLLASSSKPDPTDVLSSEEDENKEFIDPYFQKHVAMNLFPKGGPVKAFVDDEAEEEDDSDNDLMRFQENEEDDGSDENEDLKDLIASGFEEASVDHEKRNELHQKWLEQQDAAATDNVLQRLQSGHKQKRPVLSHREEDEGFSEDSGEESSCALPPVNVIHKNTKNAKHMIAQMFNDGNDVYVPSDDEESEQTLIRQCLLEKTEETTIISPLEDDNSREVFGLIKKLNTASGSKRKGNKTTTYDLPTIGGNSNSSSKSSFLGRATSNSLPSSYKKGPTVRAYIFGRDDSNSRSSLSTCENALDKGQKENQHSKKSFAKINSSQIKQVTSKTKNDANRSSGSSLFDILRQSSMSYDNLMNNNGNNSHVTSESQTARQFSAFKLGKRSPKVKSENLMPHNRWK